MFDYWLLFLSLLGEKTNYLRVTKIFFFFPQTPPLNLPLNRTKVGVKGTDPILLFFSSASPPVGLSSSSPPPPPILTRGNGFTPYLVFSRWSDPNNEPTRHSSGGGSHAGAELYKVAERERGGGISPVGSGCRASGGSANSIIFIIIWDSLTDFYNGHWKNEYDQI